VVCFVLTARESGHPLFSKAVEGDALHFHKFCFFPLFCQGRKITFLPAKESIKGKSYINKSEGNVGKQQKSKQLSNPLSLKSAHIPHGCKHNIVMSNVPFGTIYKFKLKRLKI